ncbi:MAG: alkaline phosphatase family protein [Acidobacteria bacterium]|nr:alkaline phosphatase family protein [Acidobacteriota bacterium]
MRFLRMLSNAVIAGALASGYLTVIVLQLNPGFPLRPAALVPLAAILGLAYGVNLALLFYSVIVMRQLFGSEVLSPGWLSVRLLSWLCTAAAAGGAVLMWLNLRGFGPVLDAETARRMTTGAIAVTAAAIGFFVLALAHVGRRGGRASATVLVGMMVVSIGLPVMARGTGRLAIDVPDAQVPTLGGPPAPDGPRVVLIMLDGASLDVIAPAVAAGRLPGFGRIVDGGAVLHLATLRPTQADPVWSAIATGRQPMANGVRSSARYRAQQGGAVIELLPDYCFAQALVSFGFLFEEGHTAESLRARPIWSILTDLGVAVGVVGWPLTHPAPVVNGFLVSDLFHRLDDGQLDSEGAMQISPPALVADIREAMAVSVSPDPLALATLVTPSPAGDVESRREPEPLLADRIHLQIRNALDRNGRARFLAVRFPGVDAVGHHYLRYANPTPFGDVTDAERRQLGRVLEQYYAFLDQIVERALIALEPADLLLVVSAFGMEPLSPGKRLLERLVGNRAISGTHERAPDGFLLAYGAAVAPGRPSRASVLDVTPTVLYYLGLPVGRDMDGYARADLFTSSFTGSRPITFIPSYGR